MCSEAWQYLWNMLKTASHFLGKSPTTTKRARIFKLVKEVGKTLPCEECRTDWSRVLNSFCKTGGLYQFTGNCQLFFTFIFDLNIAWNLCHSINTQQQWQEEIGKFHLMDRRADNMLVKLFPKLYNQSIIPDVPAEEIVAASCEGNVCPNTCDHLIGPNTPCIICSVLNWGVYFWEYFHTVSTFNHFYNSRKDKVWLWNHILLVGSVVPCAECYLHWKNAMGILTQHKKQIYNNQRSCFTFLFDLHNSWNKKLGKQQFTWVAALQKYNSNTTNLYDTTVWQTTAPSRSCWNSL